MPYQFRTIQNKLLPYRVINPYEIISHYTWAGAGTGLAGTLVSITVADPNNREGFNLNAPMGSSIPGTLSPQYETRWLFRPSASGDTRFNALGITLYDSRLVDENDIPVRYNPSKAADQLVLASGVPVPVLVRGIVALRADAWVGIPQPGYAAVIASGGGGKIGSVNPSTLNETGDSTAVYNSKQVVGKWLTSTGQFGCPQGGALLKIEL